MAYLKNDEFSVLLKVWFEIRENNGLVSPDTARKFGDLIKKIDQDKTASNAKAAKTIAEKRKADKTYGRPKQKLMQVKGKTIAKCIERGE